MNIGTEAKSGRNMWTKAAKIEITAKVASASQLIEMLNSTGATIVDIIPKSIVLVIDEVDLESEIYLEIPADRTSLGKSSPM